MVILSLVYRGFGKHVPDGLPLNLTLLPEYMKREGYATHALGNNNNDNNNNNNNNNYNNKKNNNNDNNNSNSNNSNNNNYNKT